MKDAIRRLNERRRMPSYRALRDAGPRERWVVGALVGGVTTAVLLDIADLLDMRLGLAIPVLATLLVGVADRNGWRIRMAMSELAIIQRSRWKSGTIPIERSAAEAWLTAHIDAPPLERAAILQVAGRAADGLELIRGLNPSTPQETIQLARMRLVLGASAQNSLVEDRALDTVMSMPEFQLLTVEERRYQRLALSWAQAWLAIKAGRPWQRAFASRIRDLEPFSVRLPHRLMQMSQHFVGAIACALFWLGYVVISSLIG